MKRFRATSEHSMSNQSKKQRKQSGGNNNSIKSNMNKKRRSKPGRSTRTRKPKYLSLRLQLAADKPESGRPGSGSEPECLPQLTLFPLHPETHAPPPPPPAEENEVAYNIFSAEEESGATSLTGILGAPSSTSTSSGGGNCNNGKSNTWYSAAALAKAALRSKGRRQSEEKWVSYSAVVESSRKEEEVNSRCAADLRRRVDNDENRRRRVERLSLKLDYEEIINAWSDKGSLYIKAESAESPPPQTVPDLTAAGDEFSPVFYETYCHGQWGGWESNGSLYTVPEMVESSGRTDGEPPQGGGGDEDSKPPGQAHRAASVLRYKEKRHNRLFSKTIRYEVRKLNAEKRPRVKGRFVKRD